MPLAVIGALCLQALTSPLQHEPYLEGTTFQDRLLFSGRILMDLDYLNWLGIGSSSAYTLDTGYAYVITGIGMVGFAVAWCWFMSLNGNNRYFYAFRNTVAAYFAALLCVSQSQFTIKTAALLWFLLRRAVRGKGCFTARWFAARCARMSPCPRRLPPRLAVSA